MRSSKVTISLAGDPRAMTTVFLQVYLVKFKLSEKQLEVITELVIRYMEYLSKGVEEPYASKLLFASDTRKEVIDVLGITSANLNNIYSKLNKKGLLEVSGNNYMMNPDLYLRTTLTFEFNIA